MNTTTFDGRVAVITGGARGLGLSIATALATHGASIALLDRLPGIEAVAERLASTTGVRVIGVNVDVTDESSVAAAITSVSDQLGTPTLLVNSAGITLDTPALDTSYEAWSRVQNVNVGGTFLMSREFARAAIAAQLQASIVNLSSMSSLVVNIPQTQAAYNTSKAAVSMLTKSLAIEWLPLGVRVNAIAPGYFASDMTRDFVAANPEMNDAWVSRIPAGRMGEPDELGDLVIYLLGDSASYVVGQTFSIDGGYTIV